MKTKDFMSTSTSEIEDPRKEIAEVIEHETSIDDELKQNIGDHLLKKSENNEKMIKKLEEGIQKEKELIKIFVKTEKLIFFILIIFPILIIVATIGVLIIIGIKIPSWIGYSVIGVISAGTIIDLVTIPKTIKKNKEKIDKLENRIDTLYTRK